MAKLPINLTDLLRQRTVEGDRIEYKAGWNPDAIIRTMCAFANDFENLGGGYVVIYSNGMVALSPKRHRCAKVRLLNPQTKRGRHHEDYNSRH